MCQITGSLAQQHLHSKYYERWITRSLLLFFSLNNESYMASVGTDINLSLLLFSFCDIKLRPKSYRILNRKNITAQKFPQGNICIQFVARLGSEFLSPYFSASLSVTLELLCFSIYIVLTRVKIVVTF